MDEERPKKETTEISDIANLMPPMPVEECANATTKQATLFYFGGYCVCSSFYDCKHQQSERLRTRCTKYDR
jgi:hypothetical protein